jgi:hypothetical protein
MPNTSRIRIDYQPGDAAQQALETAKRLPALRGKRQQELIDQLVILGLWALRASAMLPALPGQDRDRWRLPAGLAAEGESSTRVRASADVATGKATANAA